MVCSSDGLCDKCSDDVNRQKIEVGVQEAQLRKEQHTNL